MVSRANRLMISLYSLHVSMPEDADYEGVRTNPSTLNFLGHNSPHTQVEPAETVELTLLGVSLLFTAPLTLSIKIAQKRCIIGSLGPKALKYESFEGKGRESFLRSRRVLGGFWTQNPT